MDLSSYLWPFFLPILGAIIALLHIRWRHYHGTPALGIFLMWQLAMGIGASMVYGGLGHLLFADRVAEAIGWPTGNPFQREVGMWDLSIGIVGLLCAKFRNVGFWSATVIGAGIFMFAAGIGHVYEMVAHGDFSPGNAGGVMFMDLFYPLFLAGLLIYYYNRKEGRLTKKE